MNGGLIPFLIHNALRPDIVEQSASTILNPIWALALALLKVLCVFVFLAILIRAAFGSMG